MPALPPLRPWSAIRLALVALCACLLAFAPVAARAADWVPTDWGPRLAGERTWAGVRLAGEPRDVGWSVLVDCVIERLEFGADDVLVHRRGRYRTTPD